MTELLEGNVLVAQSGSAAAVANACLAGVLTEALNHECIQEVFGGIGGLHGVLNESIIDLAAESQQAIRLLRSTPGNILGEGSELKRSQDYERILSVFQANNIRYFFYIGGLEAQIAANQLWQTSLQKNYPLRVIGVPCSARNELTMTDHTPSYGSAIKSVAAFAQHFTNNTAYGRVSVLEIGDQQASGWGVAGVSLLGIFCKKEDMPVICLPEAPFALEGFLENIRGMLKRKQRCVVVLTNRLLDSNGNFFNTLDDVKAAGGARAFISAQIKDSMGAEVDWLSLDNAFECAFNTISKQDSEEAVLCGEEAVLRAVEGESGKMVVLLRGEKEAYSCEAALSPLQDVIAMKKAFPANWLDESGLPSNAYIKYALPLIQGKMDCPEDHGIPQYPVLQKRFIQRRLDAYTVA